MRRTVFAVLVGILALGVALPTADAMYQEVQYIGENRPSDSTFGPIPGNYPGNVVAIPTPSGCGNEEEEAGPFTAVCHTVPIEVIPPAKLADTDEYFITLEVSWEAATGEEDLDIYLWDDRQIARRSDPESGSYTQFTEAASADNPEIVKLFHPDLGRYNLVVVNYAGVNTGYRVKGYLTVAKGEEIFELLDPTITPKNQKKQEEDAPPVDFSAAPPSGGAGAIGDFLPPTPALNEVVVLPDSDLDDGFGASNFESALRPPGEQFASSRTTRVGPASGVAVAVSLIAIPVAAFVVGVMVFARRRRFGFAL